MVAIRCLSAVVAVVMIAMFVCNVAGDLPVHCLNTQIAGEWEFRLSELTNSPNLCGHHQPDQNAMHFRHHNKHIQFTKKYRVDFFEPNVCRDGDGNAGSWTMVYDEGFEFSVGGYKYFAFNKYSPRNAASLSSDDVRDYISHCGETLIGWYHDLKRQKWGCYVGKKTKADSSLMAEQIASSETTSNKRRSKHLSHVVAPPSSMEHSPTTKFEPDYPFVKSVNLDSTSKWQASVHEGFLGKRMHEMRQLLGRRRFNKPLPKAVEDTRSDEVKYEGLPKSWDWRNVNGVNYLTQVQNQGSCGSCFAIAAMATAEARIRIKTNFKEQPSLSAQNVVSCSFYNQGCEGGYPYLVGKHGEEFGFVDESCQPYEAMDATCQPKCEKRYYVTNYRYVGGYYGNCSEVAMMKDIYAGGPIVIAFEAPSSLFYYSGGVFTGESPRSEGQALKNLKPWEQTNHAVVAVGWGETPDGTKYWIIRNTWGQNWGTGGYFLIRRGTDECGVESMAVSFDIA